MDCLSTASALTVLLLNFFLILKTTLCYLDIFLYKSCSAHLCTFHLLHTDWNLVLPTSTCFTLAHCRFSSSILVSRWVKVSNKRSFEACKLFFCVTGTLFPHNDLSPQSPVPCLTLAIQREKLVGQVRPIPVMSRSPGMGQAALLPPGRQPVYLPWWGTIPNITYQTRTV